MNEQKKEQMERPCCRIRLKFTKCTVWPRNEPRFHFLKGPEVLQIQLADIYRGYLVSTWGSTG